MWLSLVEHYVRDVGAAGSNPVTSTEVTIEPAAGFGEFGALPPKLDRETVRGTVSKNPSFLWSLPYQVSS